MFWQRPSLIYSVHLGLGKQLRLRQAQAFCIGFFLYAVLYVWLLHSIPQCLSTFTVWACRHGPTPYNARILPFASDPCACDLQSRPFCVMGGLSQNVLYHVGVTAHLARDAVRMLASLLAFALCPNLVPRG